MNYIILDLEATCWAKRFPKIQTEIIEIGALKFDAEGNFISEFEKFVRPSLYPVLSKFCRELTSISQEDVDRADTFPEVLRQFQDWFGQENESYLLCSWGYYDKSQFERDCKLHKLDTSWLHPHISIKHQHQKIRALQRPLGMDQALKMEGFELEGTHHRGIDDARNIAKIFLKFFGEMRG